MLIAQRRQAIRQQMRLQYREQYFARVRGEMLREGCVREMMRAGVEGVGEVLERVDLMGAGEVEYVIVEMGKWLSQCGGMKGVKQWSNCVELVIKLVGLAPSLALAVQLMNWSEPLLCDTKNLLSHNKMMKYDIFLLQLDCYLQLREHIGQLSLSHLKQIVYVIAELVKMDCRSRVAELNRTMYLCNSLIVSGSEIGVAMLVEDKTRVGRVVELLQEVYQLPYSEQNSHLIETILTVLTNLTYILVQSPVYKVFLQTSFLAFTALTLSQPQYISAAIYELHLQLTLNIALSCPIFLSSLLPQLSLPQFALPHPLVQQLLSLIRQ